MDYAVMRSYFPLFQQAAWLTARLGLLGVLLTVAVGLFCAAVRLWRVPVLRGIVSAYI